MHLNEIAQDAFATAKEKGHHANLSQCGGRERVLATLTLLYVAVTEVTQHVKRHGIGEEEDGALTRLIKLLHHVHLETDFVQKQVLRERGTQRMPTVMTPLQASLVRLALIHTEVDEAVDAVFDYVAKDGAGQLARELADIHIRTAELAVHLGIDSDATVAAVLAANKARPHGYGTPTEGAKP